MNQYEYILKAIRAGQTYPDRWPEDLEEDEDGEQEEYVRWWEQEQNNDLTDKKQSKRGN
jgi:hypothetical protein